MLDVFYTVDVEIWCGGWPATDAAFADAFRRYVYGPTRTGDFGLPFQLRALRDHGLKGVFFVEPLFAARFGLAPLQEIVGLVKEAGQDVQLHLHTEWADEVKPPLVPGMSGKRQYLRYFSRAEQEVLIAQGIDSLVSAGAARPTAFRAGSFGFNTDTLRALSHNGIHIDSSYNPAQMGRDSGLSPGVIVCEPMRWEDVLEYPMTAYFDRPGHLRPAQLGACSSAELEGLLRAAQETGRSGVVLLSHNFELLTPRKDKPDRIVVERFRRLCRLLDKNRDVYRTATFGDRPVMPRQVQPPPLRSPRWKTVLRTAEQVLRRASR